MDIMWDALRLYGRDEPICASMAAFLTGLLGMSQVAGAQGDICVQPAGAPLIVVQPAYGLPAGVDVCPGKPVLDLGVHDIDALWREWEWKGVTLLTSVVGPANARAFYARMPGEYLLRVHQH